MSQPGSEGSLPIATGRVDAEALPGVTDYRAGKNEFGEPAAPSAHPMAIAGCGSVSDSVRGYPLRAFVICLIAYTTAQMDLALFGYAVPAIRAGSDSH